MFSMPHTGSQGSFLATCTALFCMKSDFSMAYLKAAMRMLQEEETQIRLPVF